MTPVQLIRSPSLAGSVQYAYAATAPAGSRIIALAGACPLGPDGATVSPGSYGAQTRVAFENMVTALGDAGAALSDILSTRLLVASSRQEDLWEAWDVYREAMGAHDAPSTLMGVTALGYRDQLVEIEAVAAVVELTAPASTPAPPRGPAGR
jgi:enamine deaminase RidA (YjgF/YER057c/UK114 family)